MSTELRTVPTTDIQQTRFFGGKDRGTCIQLTPPWQSRCYCPGPPWQSRGHIQLTREQAGALAAELMLFSEGNEVTEHLAQIQSEFDGEAIAEALCS